MANNQSYVYVGADILYACCALFLHTDGDNVDGVDRTAYNQWLDTTAQALGYTSWLDFYHAYDVQNSVSPEAPPEGVTLPTEYVE